MDVEQHFRADDLNVIRAHWVWVGFMVEMLENRLKRGPGLETGSREYE